MNIPDEAIEAAAKAMAVAHYEDDDVWQPGSHLSDVGRKRWRAEAIGVLMPAAHFIAAQAWDEGFEAGEDRGEWEAAPVRDEPVYANPYHPAHAVVRAAETFTHPTTPTAADKAAKPDETPMEGTK